ncbi:unnamed protein product [Linum tenue]|uniref:Phototropic-responsive NPH3 family protein n=1 Tax=Linum tenue TaxID=586396 RepID=A0AAV0GNE6_9ROSI|nr:unnamed protein product [Linum tenue]
MKFMKLGTRPDTFYTEEATRSLASEIPSDLEIRINGVTYLLHKFALLPRCGLLQRLYSDTPESTTVTMELHDIPGGEEAFELCAKYCYGITISLSAHNFVPAFCAAKFLRMTESVDQGSFVLKLEAFFNSCILEGWKDSITALQTTVKLNEWSENLGIIRRCIDSIVDKILTPPAKVRWSYTYTRPGFNKHEHSVPKDWWTEDISDLDIDLFRCIITALKSTYLLPPQLIGEALHVYASRWLPDTTKIRPSESSEPGEVVSDKESQRRVLETIVSMIPVDRGSVSIGFLLRLLNTANYLATSPATKAELIRRSSVQLEEATLSDILFPSHLGQQVYDIDSVAAVLESFLVVWRRVSQEASVEESQVVASIRRIGKLIHSYLQVVAKDPDMPVSKFEHPDLSKADRKRLCRTLDCQKLSPEVRAHAVKNERLPLRTVVQVLFFEQEIKGGGGGGGGSNSRMLSQELSFNGKQPAPPAMAAAAEDLSSKLQLKSSTPESSSIRSNKHERVKRPDSRKGKVEDERNILVRGEIEEEVEKGKEGSKLDRKKIMGSRSGSSTHGRDKGRDR